MGLLLLFCLPCIKAPLLSIIDGQCLELWAGFYILFHFLAVLDKSCRLPVALLQGVQQVFFVGWIVQFLNRVLRNNSLQVITIIFVIMLLAEVAVGVSILEVELHPTRCNRFFGTGWKAVNKKFNSTTAQAKAAIYISCADTAAARFEIADALTEATGGSHYANAPRYWMDFGNGKNSGQVILSTIRKVKQPQSEKFETVESLPFVTEEFGELLRQSETDDLPSCSLAEALERQDLFINSALAQMGCSLLWQLFRNGFTTHRGCFLNLGEFRAAPLPL